jgi:hypothetical protein
MINIIIRQFFTCRRFMKDLVFLYEEANPWGAGNECPLYRVDIK